MKASIAKKPRHAAPPDKSLKLTPDNYHMLLRFWWAVGQFHILLKEQPDAPDDVLGIVLEYVGPVFEALWRQELALKVKGGDA